MGMVRPPGRPLVDRMGLGLAKRLKLGLGLAAAITFAPNLAVDSVNGNDFNSGTRAAPFKTLATLKAAALAFGNGVKIEFARDSSWPEDLDLSTLAGVEGRASVGTGAMPLFDGSIVKANNLWSKTPGYTNIYQITVTQTRAEGYILVWENGVMQQFTTYTSTDVATGLTELDAVAGGMFIVNDGTGSNKTGPGSQTIYITASDFSDVITNGKTYEITDPTRDGAISIGANSILRHVHTRRNMSANGSIRGQENCIVYGSVLEDGVKHNGLLSSGIWRRCVFWKGENGVRTSTLLGEFYTSTGTGKSGLYDGCVFVGNARPSITGGVTGAGGHTDGVTFYESYYIKNCTFVNCNTAATMDANIIGGENNYIVNCLVGIQGTSRVSASAVFPDTYYYNTTATVHRAMSFSGVDTINLDGFRTYINNNTTVSSANRFLIYKPNGGTINLTRSAICIAGLPATGYALCGGMTSGVVINASGNQVQNTASLDQFSLWNASSGNATLGTMANNAYYTSANVNSTISGTTYSTAALMLAAVQPANENGSVVANPSFADPANGDFTATGPGMPSNSGILRSVTYTPVPANLNAALAYADAA